MLAVISPAKKIDESPAAVVNLPTPTTPTMMEDIEALLPTARKLTAKKLAELMSISDDLASLNRERFQKLTLPFTVQNAQPAAFAFAGDVYRGLDARSLGANDLGFAQEHLAILSGLYGLLRPLDLIQPYRLEMGTRLQNPRGPSLYAFWGERIAAELRRRLETHQSRVLVNLASTEYFKAVKVKVLGAPVVTCLFEDYKEHVDERRTVSFLAKVARGTMARYIIEQRVDTVDGLRAFDFERYKLQKKYSSDDTLVFARKFIPIAQRREE